MTEENQDPVPGTEGAQVPPDTTPVSEEKTSLSGEDFLPEGSQYEESQKAIKVAEEQRVKLREEAAKVEEEKKDQPQSEGPTKQSPDPQEDVVDAEPVVDPAPTVEETPASDPIEESTETDPVPVETPVDPVPEQPVAEELVPAATTSTGVNPPVEPFPGEPQAATQEESTAPQTEEAENAPEVTQEQPTATPGE